jgi:tRNA-2-methylthio-N6-dimethylallyladenosine synthase
MARVKVHTFGCQMNVHDSERMEEVLVRSGSEVVEGADDAEVVVLNTCSVREKAEQKLRSEVGRLARLKRRRPNMVLVVAGCLAQQEGEKILRQIPSVDLVLGPDNIVELPELLREIQLGAPPMARTVFDTDAPRFLTATSVVADKAQGRKATAFVTTMKGCDERCSFCIVPYTRGPERYRPSDQILGEIAALVDAGVREVTLLGQTVNSYRDPLGALPPAPAHRPDDPDESEFAALLRAIAEQVPALQRLRYTSPHPRHLTPSLIEAHRDLPLLPRHVHLPVQSGSSRMLKRMIRRHTREEYLERVARLRERVAGCSVSTDIIVGFCGETEQDFEQTLSLIEEVGFVGVYAFKYSPRPYTPALKMNDDVPREVKGERLARLFAVTERLFGEHLSTLVGTRQRVLVEGASKNPNHLSGRSERNEIVHIDDAAHLDLVGEVLEVEVVEAFKHSLLARLGDEDRTRFAARPRTTRRTLPVVAGGGG